jgi:hypothetical protein
MLFLLLIASCKKEHEFNKADKNEKELTVEDKITLQNSNEIEYNDTINSKKIKEIELLKSMNLISQKFNAYNNVVFLENFNNYYLMKLVYSQSLGKNYIEDPYVNFIYSKENDSILEFQVLYSIDMENISFLYYVDDTPIFEEYDSATGWKRYHTFSKKIGAFIESARIDEDQEIDSINIDDLTYRIINTNEVENFKINKGKE